MISLGSETERDQRAPLRAALPYLLPLLLCLASFAAFAIAARHHPLGTYWTETDFYHYYGPDAVRIAAGKFPQNPYQGPGFPALVALVSRFTGDGFVAGKWISVVCATLTVALTFLLFARLFGYWVGLGAAALVPVSAQFPQFAIGATTDALFLMLAVGCFFVLVEESIGIQWRVALASGIAGFAYVVRYNGLFLPATILLAILALNIAQRDWRGRLKLSAVALVVFLVTTSPWLYANYVHRGSPFYNANYLNMATEFYPELADGKTNQDGTRGLEATFASFADVLRYDPGRMLRRYPVNLYESLRQILRSDLLSELTGWLALAGLLIVVGERRSKAALMLITALVIYFLLMGLNHWETRYYFFVMVVFCGLAVYAVARFWELLRARIGASGRVLVLAPIAVFAGMWWSSFVMARNDLRGFLASHPMEVVSACDYLRAQGIHGAKIVARKPHLPVICGQEWVFFPPVKSIDELREWLIANPADYLVISSIEVKRRKELSALRSSATAPPWLEVAWESQDPLLVLYRPRFDRSGK
ncbi:MAG: glycosyltransferase family 39 protein [Acidobacteriota bacterium]